MAAIGQTTVPPIAPCTTEGVSRASDAEELVPNVATCSDTKSVCTIDGFGEIATVTVTGGRFRTGEVQDHRGRLRRHPPGQVEVQVAHLSSRRMVNPQLPRRDGSRHAAPVPRRAADQAGLVRHPAPSWRLVPVGSTGMQVVYAPERDGDPDPGEVVWGWVPYEDDPAMGKDRPLLVIGYAGAGDRLLAVPLSSKNPEQKRDAHEWVPVGVGGWDHTQRESYANADRLLRYDPANVRREGAALPRDRFDAVVDKARALGNLPS